MSVLKDALRSLRRAPALPLAAALCIAVGSAATTTIATLAEVALLRPLPFPDADRLVRVWLDEQGVDPRLSLSIPEAHDLRTLSSFDIVLPTARVRAVALLGDGAERLRGEAVTPGYFETLGIRPALGRFLEAGDHDPAAPPAIVLSYGTWMRGFGADAGVLGRPFRTERAIYTIVGVAAQQFEGTVEQDVVDFWTPLNHYEPASMRTDRAIRQTWAVARLRPGTTQPAAQTELDGMTREWKASHPDLYRARRLYLEPFGESWRAGYRHGVIVLAGASAGLLAIAGLNVGCLLVARVLNRRRELAVRAAIGAGRRHIAAALLAEAAVIVVAGGAGGVLAGSAVLDFFLSISPVALPRYVDVSPDARALSASIAALGAAGLIAGTVPVLLGGRVRAAEVLNEAGRGNTGPRAERRAVAAIVTVQVALTLTLLVSGGLLLRAYDRLSTLDVGYRRDGIARLAITFSRADAGEPASRTRLFERIRTAIAAYPGVEHVGLVAPTLPPWDAQRARIRFPELSADVAPAGLEVGLHLIDEGFAPTLAIPILEGRNFTPADGARGELVAIVSAALARRLGGPAQALGRDVDVDSGDPAIPSGRYRVVGVAGDVSYDGIGEQGTGRPIRYGVATDARGGRDDLYLPLLHVPLTRISIAAFTRGDESTLVDPLRRELARIAPTSAVHWTGTMHAEIGLEYAPTRFYALLVSAFSASALALTSVGLFALLSHAAARRSGEMGIRLALGATPLQVGALLLRGMMMPLAAGGAAGLMGATWAASALASLLYDVGMWDLRAFAGAVAALCVVAICAGLLPARRAARVDPLVVLRTS